jgi:hypothetical protein
MHTKELYFLCKQHVNKYVQLQGKDGMMIKAIITDVDDQNVYLAVPTGGGVPTPTPHRNEQGDSRSFGYGYPGYGGFPGYGYGGYPGYGYGPGFGGGFSQLILPLTFLAALSAVPYF